MKISIVTISYNQSVYLEKAINSVLNQDYKDIEYIVVDAGSTDGSREIIQKYRNLIDKVIFEPDGGPAEGLNKGFELAKGNIYGFLNSDDILFPGVVTKVIKFFEANTHIDVVSGDAVLIDENDTQIRKLCSDQFSLIRHAYGANFLAQQSTFFRSAVFNKVGGFNSNNHFTWDGELFVDIALSGGRFAVVKDLWSGFRLHQSSISFSGKFNHELDRSKKIIFKKIMRRDLRPMDHFVGYCFRVVKHLLNLRGLVNRISLLFYGSAQK
jgi:glycosyltransferase involved in cell wall biosynthesis